MITMKRPFTSLNRLCRFPGFCIVLFWIAVGLLVGVTAFVLLIPGTPKFQAEAALDLRRRADRVSDGASGDAPGKRLPLRVAIAPVISPEATLGIYSDLIAYLARGVNRRPVFLRGESYSEVNDLIRMRLCDVAMVCTYSYVLTEEELGAQLLAVPQIDGKKVYHSLIVVPAASKATSLSDLRGLRFASGDILSCSGWLYPVARLKEEGIDAAEFFREHAISGSHDRSVFAVRSGVAGAAAVDSLVYEQMLADDPRLGDELKVIERSPPFGMPPFIVPAHLPTELFQGLQRTLLDMHRDDDGRRVLQALGFELFLSAADEEYDSVRELHEQWQTSL